MILSLAFLGISAVRYFRDKLAELSQTLLRRSFVAYLLHPLPLLVALGLRAKLDFEGHGPFLVASLCLTLLLLTASIYFGFRSKSSAGSRLVVAGSCMFAAIILSDPFSYS